MPNDDLPEGWATDSIASVFEVNPSPPPKSTLPENAQVTFVPMPAVDAQSGTIADPQTKRHGEVRSGHTAFAEGDVIIARITPCMENGKAAVARKLINGFGFGSTEFHVLRPTGAVSAEFAYHFVRQEWFRRAAADHMTGSVGQKRVPAEFIKKAEIPVAPLAEQKRIVAKVAELLGRGNAARERLARMPAILKRFRQSVLAAACSGRLTEDWRESVRPKTPADNLLAGILAARPKRWEQNTSQRYKAPLEPSDDVTADIPETWARATVDQLSCLVTSGSRWWARYYSDFGAIFVRAQDINSDALILENVAHVTAPDDAEARRTRLELGDLLVTITGANVTKSALVEVDLPEAYMSQHVALVRLVDPSIRRFVYLWITSPVHGRRKLLSDAYGAGKPALNLDNIKSTVVGLPPFEEQQEIVRRVQALFKLADAVEKRVKAATTQAERLTQAILAKAFRGGLVPTEADLARRDGRDYEAASVLLERVRQERAAAAQTARPNRPARRRSERRRSR